MPNATRRAAVIASARIPFARSKTAFVQLGNAEMLTTAMTALVKKYDLRDELPGEVAAGAVIKHSRDWNLAREAALGSGLHPHTPAYDVQRACGTSLTTVIQLAHRIALGEIDSGIAGGADTAEMRAGAAYAHSALALDAMDEVDRRSGASVQPKGI